jgi:hypothetical protein
MRETSDHTKSDWETVRECQSGQSVEPTVCMQRKQFEVDALFTNDDG